MLQRVVLGQVRFNLPGLVADARGVVVGRQLVARFAAIDRLVGFLRVLSAEQSIDDLQPGLRIVYARGGAGTREAIVLMPVGRRGSRTWSRTRPGSRAARRSPGPGKQFVQYRDARAPFGYDVAALSDVAGDLILHGTEQMVPVPHRERAAAGEAAAAPVAGAGGAARRRGRCCPTARST